MGQVFDAGEIFKIAIEMERNGAEFYRNAAGQVSEEEHRRMLRGLAEMEDEHIKTFNDLSRQLSAEASDYFDPDGYAARYLKSIADTRIFFEREIDMSSMEAILKEAIQAEEDSIVFYVGMKEMVPDETGKEKIEAIIKEEMGHVRLLSELLTEQG